MSFSLEPGEVVGLLGRNGAGKTTLLRIAMGMLEPQAGAVEVFATKPLSLGFDPVVFEGRFGVPGPSMLALVLTVMVMTVAVGLSGSTEVWRRPPLEVLRAE